MFDSNTSILYIHDIKNVPLPARQVSKVGNCSESEVGAVCALIVQLFSYRHALFNIPRSQMKPHCLKENTLMSWVRFVLLTVVVHSVVVVST